MCSPSLAVVPETDVRQQAVEKRPSAVFPSSFAVQRTRKYASRLRISGALHLDIFEHPVKSLFQQAPRAGSTPVDGDPAPFAGA
jgi:hypothetical protein